MAMQLNIDLTEIMELPRYLSVSYILAFAVFLVCFYYCLKYLILCYKILWKLQRIANAVSAFPGPPRHWLYGNLHQIPGFGERGLAWFSAWAERCPKAMTVWIGPFMPLLIVHHPETCKTILRSTQPKQVSGMGGYSLLKRWLGYGLLLLDGPKWFRNRRLLTPGFHFDVLKPYINIHNKATTILLDTFRKSSSSGRSVDIFHPVGLCTLEIILKCAFSSDMPVQVHGQTNPYVNAVLRISKLIMKRALNPLLYPELIYNLTAPGREFNNLLRITHDVSNRVIRTRRDTLENNSDDQKKRYPDFLDLLLLAKDDNDKGLTDEEIRAEVDTFLFEGHDTTTSAISWTLYMLAKHPEHQLKCYEEVSTVLSNRDSDHMEWEDMNSLPYLTLCIKETMRLLPPVPIIGRELDTEMVVDGVTLPMGTNVQFLIHSLHHNTHIWGNDHNVFRPQRFNSDTDTDSFAFLPFSAGPRNCIGQNFAMQEIKIVVSRTINRYQLATDPEHPGLPVVELVMRSEDGLHVFFAERPSA